MNAVIMLSSKQWTTRYKNYMVMGGSRGGLGLGEGGGGKAVIHYYVKYMCTLSSVSIV